MEKYKKNPELIEKNNESALLLFNVNSGVMVELNETAKLLWNKTGDSFNLPDLKKIIKEKCFNLDKNTDKDLEEFIEKALKKDLIKKQ